MEKRRINKVSNKGTTFEYIKDKNFIETDFDVFLRYTDEKEESSKIVSKVISENASDSKHLNLLDIGSGNGDYLFSALTKIS